MCVCLGGGGIPIDLSCLCIVLTLAALDKLTNVNTDTVLALTSPSFLLSCRDLKIENLLLDEQDNIKLIGKNQKL